MQEKVGVCKVGDLLEAACWDGNAKELQLFCLGFVSASVPKDQSGQG